MAIKYLAGDRLIGTTAERTALSGSTPTAIPQTSWKELARVTLSSTATSFGTTFADKDNIMVLILWSREGGASADPKLQLGDTSADTGSNYARRLSANGGTDSTNTSADYSSQWATGAGSDIMNFQVIQFRNTATKEKLGIEHGVFAGATGSGTAPNRTENVFKWVNTSVQAGYIRYYAASGTTFSIGSEIVVLGCDDDEADSGTNFWQELASPTETSGNITTTFTAKKYLWCSVHAENSGSIQPELFLGDGGSIDTGNNYASRGSVNGASDWTRTGHDSIESEHATSSPIYGDCFGVNVANKEKLWIIHWIYENTGTGNAPERVETVGKWTNTSAQANTIGFKESGSGSYSASRFRLWGSD